MLQVKLAFIVGIIIKNSGFYSALSLAFSPSFRKQWLNINNTLDGFSRTQQHLRELPQSQKTPQTTSGDFHRLLMVPSVCSDKHKASIAFSLSLSCSFLKQEPEN